MEVSAAEPSQGPADVVQEHDLVVVWHAIPQLTTVRRLGVEKAVSTTPPKNIEPLVKDHNEVSCIMKPWKSS